MSSNDSQLIQLIAQFNFLQHNNLLSQFGNRCPVDEWMKKLGNDDRAAIREYINTYRQLQQQCPSICEQTIIQPNDAAKQDTPAGETITSPVLPDTVASAEVCNIHVNVGDMVKKDEIVIELETDKVILEIVATKDGRITAILVNDGDSVKDNEPLFILD
jgi:biotin carboxyl carrier protein